MDSFLYNYLAGCRNLTERWIQGYLRLDWCLNRLLHCSGSKLVFNVAELNPTVSSAESESLRFKLSVSCSARHPHPRCFWPLKADNEMYALGVELAIIQSRCVFR